MTLALGDKVTSHYGKQGSVQEVESDGVWIHWPTAFGWANGHSVWYTHDELEKWSITKEETKCEQSLST